MPDGPSHFVMTPEQVLQQLPVEAWRGPFDASVRRRALEALESGKVLVLPLPFAVLESEQRFLDAAIQSDRRKNLSFDPASGKLGNAALPAVEQAGLAAMMQRFADSAFSLIMDLLPSYATHLARSRTSFRPAEIEGRTYSLRHDDRLLHVDAFPTRPLHGQRILRLFTNVAPDGTQRKWHIGEPFADYAGRFLPEVKRPLPGSAWVLKMTGLTKGRRSLYDHIMLGLHDAGKRDAAYQASCSLVAADFPPGTTWLCFTDQV
ncbi:MAG TPA: Kdo hydroxylase family protein, partial [Acetobacteraceae bacterium]|nr:Kdo hydroxylase family protein [Acetobacteraceae bacterium]